jgi:hypothetical protein
MAQPLAIVGNRVVLTRENALNINGVGHTSTAPVASPLQLIAWQSPDGHARRLVVTLAPIQRQGSPQTPWFGTPANPAGRTGTPIGSGYGAPNVGRAFIRLQWGAGGVSQQTVLEYPVIGGSFGIVASNVKIDVWVQVDPTQWVTSDDFPVFTAWVGPGEPPPVPMPLGMYVQGGINQIGAGVVARFGFKSTNVRALKFSFGVALIGGAQSTSLILDFIDSGATIIKSIDLGQILNVEGTTDPPAFTVPPAAVAWQLTNSDGVNISVAFSAFEEICLA